MPGVCETGISWGSLRVMKHLPIISSSGNHPLTHLKGGGIVIRGTSAGKNTKSTHD